MNRWHPGLLFAAIAAASYAIVAIVRMLARERMLDLPNERSSHSSPTPRGGGLAIVILTVATLSIAGAMRSLALDLRITTIIVMTSAAIALLGFWDDVRSLPARARLLTQFLAATAATTAIGAIETIPFAPGASIDVKWLGIPLTVTWIVGLTNAYNFMDGIDGIAGSQALIAALAWAIIGALSANPLLVIAGIAIAGGSAGFLWHNWPPARIFMGDVGSGFLGFTFALLTVVASRTEPRAVVAGVLFVWPFVFDTSFTFFKRLYRRENVFEAHRTHLYQRLVIAGSSHKTVTTIYAMTTSLCALAGIAFYVGHPIAAVLAPSVAAGTAITIYLMVRRAERRR